MYITISPAEVGCLLQSVEFRIRYLHAKLDSRLCVGPERVQIGASLSQLMTMATAFKNVRADNTYRTPATHTEIPDP